jgi:thermitase
MVSGIVARFAPGAQIMPVRVLNSDGVGTLWTIVEGLKYAVANHAQVINLSLSFARNSGVLTNAVNDAWAAGAIVVCAAGNRNSQVPIFPAGNSHVITVAGLDAMNAKASFSNFGATVDVCAPAVKVVSTYWDGSYMAWSGTSFSAPMAAAEAALLVALTPGQSPNAIKQTIIATSHSVNSFNPDYFNLLGKCGAGLIDFDAAICASNSGKNGKAQVHQPNL